MKKESKTNWKIKIATKTLKILFMLFYSEIAPVLSSNTGQIVTRKRKGMISKGQKALWRVCVLPFIRKAAKDHTVRIREDERIGDENGEPGGEK